MFRILSRLLPLLVWSAALAQDDPDAVRKQADELHGKKEYRKEIELLAKLLERDPKDVSALYNTACAYALLNRNREAVEFLTEAVEAGFSDFEHIQSDEDLESIRKEEGYRKLLEGRSEKERSAFEKRVKEYTDKLGGSYRTVRDEPRRTTVISDMAEDKFTMYVGILGNYQDYLHSTLFEHLPTYDLLVLIPNTPEDYQRKLGGRSGAAGFYTPATKTLTVNLKTGGGTMIHEWVHAMHFADQAGHRQKHPIWIIEGLGSLYEQSAIFDGRPIGYTNWRLKGAQDAIQQKKMAPVKDFVQNSDEYFRQNAGLSYAQTRYMFYWLQESRKLRKFYSLYVSGFSKDKTGLTALEKVLGKKVDAWTNEWETFVLGLTFQGMGSTSLPRMGLEFEGIAGGLKIVDVDAKGAAAEAGVRKDDVLVKVEGKAVATLAAFHDQMEDKRQGEIVKLTVERDGKRQDLKVKLK